MIAEVAMLDTGGPTRQGSSEAHAIATKYGVEFVQPDRLVQRDELDPERAELVQGVGDVLEGPGETPAGRISAAACRRSDARERRAREHAAPPVPP